MAQILVVDDDASMRSSLRQVLEMQGYRVVEATDGYEGLRSYRANPTDLVITDMQMPRMNGQQMIMEMRRAFPTAKIIAISGEQSTLTMVRTLTQHTFEKPLQLQPLLAAVQALATTSAPPALAPGVFAAPHNVQGSA